MIFHSLLTHLINAATTSPIDPACNAVICSGSSSGIAGGNKDIGSVVGKIMKAVFGLMGSLAVVVVIVGGLQYTLSSGDPKRTATAKNTILYAAIGIVISLSSYAIVTFITKGLS